MFKPFITLALALSILPASAQQNAPLELRGMGSFHTGGRLFDISGKPTREIPLGNGASQKVDPNGQFLVEQMYTQFYLPKTRRGKLPLLMWHGGGLTGVTYESTPDGREGWLNMFVRKGWDTYVSDAVERGRAGWAPPEVFKGEPVFTTLGFPWEAYRLGPAGSWNADPSKRKPYAGSQFPVEAYDNLLRQIVPRWITTDPAIDAGYLTLIDKICPCALLVHSQSGTLGYRAALARPDKIKALIDIEGTLRGDASTVAKLKHIPMLVLYGDNIDDTTMFGPQRKFNLNMASLAKAAGGSIEVINLPDLGMKGNTHFMMMERNNAQIADYIDKWLASKGLAE